MEIIRKLKKTIKFIQIWYINTNNKKRFNTANFVIYGMMYDIMLNLYKPFSVKFLQRIGGEATHVALLNSFPGLLTALVVFPATILIQNTQNKKKITATLFLLSRLFLLTFACVVYLPKNMVPIVFILFFSMMNIPDVVSQCSLQSYIGYVFSPKERGDAISIRNKFGNGAVCIVTLASGFLLSVVAGTPEEKIKAYQLFFVIAFLFGLCEILMFKRFKEPLISPILNTDKKSIDKAEIKKILKNKKFLHFSLISLFFYFTWHMGWPLFNILQVQYLNAGEMWIATAAVANGFSIFLTSKWWFKQMKKKGSEPAMALAVFCLALNACLGALSPNMLVFSLFAIMGGFATAGINNCLLSGLLENTPDDNRVIYIGAFNALVNISLGISPLIALLLLKILSIQNALYIVGGLRTLAGLVFLFVGFQKVKKKQLSGQ